MAHVREPNMPAGVAEARVIDRLADHAGPPGLADQVRGHLARSLRRAWSAPGRPVRVSRS